MFRTLGTAELPLKLREMEIDHFSPVFVMPPDASFRIEHDGQPFHRVAALLPDIAAPTQGICARGVCDEIHVPYDGSAASAFVAMSDALVTETEHDARIIAEAVIFDVESTDKVCNGGHFSIENRLKAPRNCMML